MCGITGVFAFKGGGAQYDNYLKNAINELRQRGPDCRGSYAEKSVLLGHSRLSIIDTSSAANQPFHDNENRYVIVFNGEIYNYLAIKKDLTEKGYQFRTTSDTEVLLVAYKEYKEKCHDLLNGFFAFAIYDSKEDHLFIARDRMGIKPLYYYQDDKVFIFGSELKSLLAFNIDKSISQESLYFYLQLNYIPEPYSIFRSVKKLEKGHYMTISSKKIRIHPYYQLNVAYDIGPDNNTLSFEKASKRLHKLVVDSVEKRLVSDVPIGSFLSGGLDSSIIAACANKSTNNLNTFSIGFKDEPLYDETRYAEQMADHLKTNHTSFTLSNDDLLHHLDDVLNYIDEPFADSSAIPVSILSKHTRKHVTVALSGDGGDELFGGYNKHRADLLVRNKHFASYLAGAIYPLLKSLPKSRNGALSNIFRQLEKLGLGSKLSNKDRYWLWCTFSSSFQANSWMKSGINELVISSMIKQFLPFFNERNDFNDVLANDMHLVLTNDMLVKVDRMSMSHSLEVRVPLLDHKIVDFAFGLPSAYKINNKIQKHILKDAFKDFLPLNIINRKKHGFEVPLLKWFQGDLYQRIDRDWLQKDRIAEQGIFNVDSIELLKKRLFMKNPGDVPLDLWKMIVFQHWYKKHIMN